ncbi:MAG: hypothetical protein F6K24_32855 [Okeania sp. SIO2D1]|nr:hypothetical protein [Okeania sp. SIO2D1]
MMKKDLIGKKEEGRRKKEEGRRKKEEGRRKKEEGRRKKKKGKIWRCLSFKLLRCPRLFLRLLHT